MNDATQAYVNIAVIALEKIMGDEDDDSREHGLQLLGRRLERHGREADVDVWAFCEARPDQPERMEA